MKLTESAVKHQITTFMVFIALLLLGLVSLSRVGLELFPDITYPTAGVFTRYTGVGPYEIESKVSRPIEEAIAAINGVERISSTSSEGISMVIINFTWATNMDTIVTELREKLTDIEDDLPEEAGRPVIFKFNPEVLPSIVFNVSAASEGLDLKRLAEKQIVPELEKLEGVAEAQVFGGKEAAVSCLLDLDSLAKTQIPITQIMGVFKGENVNLPGGSIDFQDKYMAIRTIGEFSSLEDIGNVLVGYREAVPVFLKDIAEVRLGHLQQEEFVRTEGSYGVQIDIRKQPGFNTVEVNRRVKSRLNELKSSLPSSVKIAIQSDQSVSILQSLGGVTNAAWQGGLLAVLVLLLFLRNIGSTIIISLAIPVSVVTTFILLDFGDISMNIMSLAGITLGIGMLVDNSIVVLESNYRKQLSGMTPKEAAIRGTAEVARPIIASTLTTIAVFLPLVFVEGIAGLIFRDLAYTISFALLVSLAMALTLMPVLCARFLKLYGTSPVSLTAGTDELGLTDVEIKTGKPYLDKPSRIIQAGLKTLDNLYEKILSWSLQHSLIILLTALVLLGSSLGSITLLGMEFLSETDEGKFSISLETKVGSPFSRTVVKVAELEKTLMTLLGPELSSVSANIGRGGTNTGLATSGSHLALIDVALVGKDDRDRSIWEIINAVSGELRNTLVDVNFTINVEGVGSLVNTALGDTVPIVIAVEGDDLDQIHAFSREIEEVVRNIAGTRDTRISFQAGKPELQFQVKRREASSLGITPLEIAGTVRTAIQGAEVSLYREGGIDYTVVLGLKEEDKRDLSRLTNLFLVNPAGTKILLENVVDITEATGPIAIRRQNRTRVIKVTAALSGERALSKVDTDIRRGVDRLGPPPPGIRLRFSGSAKEMGSSFRSLLLALLLALALVYMVMASQFESLLHPFIVMFSVPFAVVGMVLALLVTNTVFSIVAFIGGILLVGIVVNNAIVLIDYINLLRKQDMPLKQAIVRGATVRLKPILMTTLTTVLGLLPMALGFGMGAEMRAPMARAIVGGLSTSTLITLILIPTLYWIIESKIRKST